MERSQRLLLSSKSEEAISPLRLMGNILKMCSTPNAKRIDSNIFLKPFSSNSLLKSTTLWMSSVDSSIASDSSLEKNYARIDAVCLVLVNREVRRDCKWHVILVKLWPRSSRLTISRDSSSSSCLQREGRMQLLSV